MTDLAIFEDYPELADLPRAEFADVPTPVQKIEDFGKQIGVPSLYLKRDDLTGELYGGNKTRKLEFIIGDALESECDDACDEIWTVGGIGSHHVLATALYARKFGLDPVALQFPQPVTKHVKEILLALSTTDPELTLASNRAKLPIEMAKVKIREWLQLGPDMKYVPAGGSSPLGVLGYVNAAFELRDQIEENELPLPDYIFVAAGTTGTLAGLTLGCRLAGLRSKVVGIRVIDRLLCNSTIAAQKARKCAEILEEYGVDDAPSLGRNDFIVLSDYFGGEYGKPSVEGERARTLFDEHVDDVELDPTYTAKAVSGMIGDRDMLALKGKDVLYWHTLNSVDLSERIDSAEPQDLPEEYQRFFEDSE